MRKSRRRNPPLPPGPPSDPFIGHVRKIPAKNQDVTLYKLGKTYGDVIYLEMLGRPMIVLNSVKAAVDLLDKRSANYSDRPSFPVFKSMGWTETLTYTSYGKSFQKHRRLFKEHLKSTNVILHMPTQTQEARILLQNLLLDESRREDWLRRFSTSIIMQVAYGHQIASDEDPYLQMTEHISHSLSNAGSPGNTPVDFFPILNYLPSWFPGAYYAGFARKQRSAIRKLHDYPFYDVKAQLAAGTAKPSFVSHMLNTLDDVSDDSSDIVDIKGVAGQMYCAGAETTWTTLTVFFLAMVLHPECQKRAQREIDTIVGLGRLPQFQDRESLPYVECILQETLRWNPVVPLGVPHRSLEDDVYRGMFIPKGSLVIANTRGMALDEEVYTDPEKFNPSRYLPLPEGTQEPHPNGPFGFGRRICPGRRLADASIWIAMASILATFDILKPIGADGKEITPDVEFSTGITSRPSSFDCRIRPRNDQAKNLILHIDTSDNY
ncbi:O-methylsterigmatocystin oxidoreductase [Termitomyces sp. J132]|nr:O-methylsterigmatocystin oxidoreductase [Termitomyces sp. J132]